MGTGPRRPLRSLLLILAIHLSLSALAIADSERPPMDYVRETETKSDPSDSSRLQGIDRDTSLQLRVMTIVRGPYQVRIELLKQELPAEGIGGSSELNITVKKGNEKFERSTFLIGADNLRAAFGLVKKGTRLKGRYLFVRTECGGGNAWRCNRDAVFTVQDGQLRSLGDLFAGGRDTTTISYRDGYFWDLYDKFEMNGLTDHARAPAFFVALKDEGGVLKADLRRTWLRNLGEFKRRVAEIGTLKTGTGHNRKQPDLESAIIANTVLATYCERMKEAAKMERLAERHFVPADLERFRKLIAHVKPGEHPIVSEKE